VFTLKPIFDVHFGNRMCDVDKFRDFLKDADDPRTLFIGGGDLIDAIIIGDKRYRKEVDASPVDDLVDYQVDTMTEILKPYAKRIIGLGSGNHEETLVVKAGTNPIRRICKNLNVPFLGYSWLVRLAFREIDGRGRTVILRGHHGWGGGSRTQGGELTKYAKDVAFWDADIFLYGHGHARKYDEIPRLGLKGSKLVAKPKILLLCGSFLKTLSEGGTPSYSEIGGYPPIPIGGVEIMLQPDKTGVKVWTEMGCHL
jgi:hypothetical protein